MISTHPTYLSAFNIAMNAHKGQFRRDGKTPYFHHVMDVSKRCAKYGIDAMALALIHDVLEDNVNYDEKRLIDAGIPKNIVDGAVILTKTKEDHYFDTYLVRVKNNELAKLVKIQDILSNLNDDPTDSQMWKYSNALVYLLKTN
jgi:(p)ppGpp synthase/HD superfamily hydrolase